LRSNRDAAYAGRRGGKREGRLAAGDRGFIFHAEDLMGARRAVSLALMAILKKVLQPNAAATTSTHDFR
jgi:hypothetical protein